ncbi:MAG: ABC transporter ATP-binding protein [Oscillospiraceae bacterium]|jgi:ABC-2 type transport system ATP-binding protein|nr:ABC transporter ATP-binding protein [Oscillospiraceae bacterium]
MIVCENVTLRYNKHIALQNVSFTVKENTICGLLGRNGAGKTSLLSLLAAYRQPTEGNIRVFGETPYENAAVMPKIAFVYGKSEEGNTLKVREVMELTAAFRPNWDADYASLLAKRFELPLKKSVQSLSHGQKAALHVAAGLAARTPLTIYDEAYLGMDAAYRKMFISEILEDYMQNPRTILFSTHYIDEMDSVFSEAIILDKGRLIAHEDCDVLRQKGVTVSGEITAVDTFSAGHEILSARTLGNQKEAVLFGAFSARERSAAASAGLTLSTPPLQDLFIHMTDKGDYENEK